MARQLYVTNIPFQATEEELIKLFSVSGKVRSVKILADPDTGKSKGCGFVEMATDAEAKDAVLTLDDALFIDRQITVVEARPQSPKQAPPQGAFRKYVRPSGKGRK
jgi:RNA recognition motif-containing protein